MKQAYLHRLLSVIAATGLTLTLADLARSQIEDFVIFDCASFGGNCTREIPDYDPNSLDPTLSISLEVPEESCATATAVGARLQIEHTWVGDLQVKLTHDSSNRTVTLIDRPGVDTLGPYGCPGHDVDVRIRDDTTIPGIADYTCDVTVPAIVGDVEHSGLSAFANLPCAGGWTLEVADRASPNFGRVLDWSLLLLPAATATPTATNTATATPTSTEPPTAIPETPPATPTELDVTATPNDATATPTGDVDNTPTAVDATATATIELPPPTDTPTLPPGTPTEPIDTPTPGRCVGDCDGNGVVSISELIRGVRIALGQDSIDTCPSFDRDNNGTVEISELIDAVNNALNGCP
jgi:subtilisin-like proprotein convertase family protein